MIIKRDRYLNKIISHRHNGMIKIITGIRRSGKSYLLFELYHTWLLKNGVNDDQIIRIALDDIENEKLHDPLELNKYISERIANEEVMYYIFIDEIQYAISMEELKNKSSYVRIYGVLNSLLRRRNVDVYITGSNSRLLSTDVMTEFRGRGDEIRIAPLSFSEYLPACGMNQENAWRDYTYYGGLPHILAEPDGESKIHYLNQLNSEIYLRDIEERYGISNRQGMEELMKVIASSIGSLTNPQKIADTFRSHGQKGISAPTIHDYLKYMQDAFIVQKAERYDIKGRKYISTPAKYYYSDIGLRNALLNFRQYEETHIMENIIYNELRFRGFNVDVGIVKTTEKKADRYINKQLEVDFIAELGSLRYYIQSALSLPDKEKIEQESASLIRIPDSFKKIIIVKDRIRTWRTEQGIAVMNIFDFLLEEHSLEL